MDFFSASGLSALFQVIAIDLVLAGDNAIIIGMAAAGLPAEMRKKAIFIGILAATVLRIIFALTTTWLLAMGPFLLIGGGLLLLWVAWKMWRELRTRKDHKDPAETILQNTKQTEKNWKQAAYQIILADISMSLDNVLAVAGAALDNKAILIIGLSLSILLMAFAASFVANLLQKYKWITYLGLMIILYVSMHMTMEGIHKQFFQNPPQLNQQQLLH